MRKPRALKWLTYVTVVTLLLMFVAISNKQVILEIIKVTDVTKSGTVLPVQALDLSANFQKDESLTESSLSPDAKSHVENKTNDNTNLHFEPAANRKAKLVAKMNATEMKNIKLFCMVKTCPKNFAKKAVAVKKTWGKRCDKLLFVSTTGNNSLELPIIGVLPGRTESKQLLAQKVFRGLYYVYENYVNDFDWFYVCDDDTYMIVENMKMFLSDKVKNDPVYFGHRFMRFTPQGYSSGGSGYVMSQEALTRIGTNGKKEKLCNQGGAGSDFKVGQCLYKLGVQLKNSTDAKGRSRFHCFNVEGHLFGKYPKWYINYTLKADGARPNDMSDYPISFHYSAGNKMYLMDYLLYGSGVWGLKTPDSNT